MGLRTFPRIWYLGIKPIKVSVYVICKLKEMLKQDLSPWSKTNTWMYLFVLKISM